MGVVVGAGRDVVAGVGSSARPGVLGASVVGQALSPVWASPRRGGGVIAERR